MKKLFIVCGLFLICFFLTANSGISEQKEKSDIAQEQFGNMSPIYSSVRINGDILTFKQRFRLKSDSFVELFGDNRATPKNVVDNQRNIRVVMMNNVPCAFLKKGDHYIRGEIALSPEIKKIRVPNYINVLEFSSENEIPEIKKLTSHYLNIKAIDLTSELNDELFDDMVDIANKLDLNLQKIMFHFIVETF